MSELHVIFGTGPVGCWTARALRERNLPVRAINRSGQRPDLMPADVEIIAADASDPAQAIAAAKGATVIYQALNPAYHKWPNTSGAAIRRYGRCQGEWRGYVSIENLYMYDAPKPITETSPIKPHSQKGELRARLAEEVMAAHKRGEIRATALRSSNYYGPGVLSSSMGDMVFSKLVAGKKAQVGGSATMPHSVAYIEDVGKRQQSSGTHDAALGQVWITAHAAAAPRAT